METIVTGAFKVRVSSSEIVSEGKVIKIRPRTFELLLMLMRAEGRLVSKSKILEQIWDDVGVDDQVIFQSVKEIRKVFARSDVIKNVPRKGYSWSLPVEYQIENRKKKRHYFTVASGAVAFLLLLSLVAFWVALRDEPQVATGSILVLPVTNTLTDTDHRWVRYGVMDQLIQRLPLSQSYGVYQAVDVLDVLKRAEVSPERFDAAEIERIFAVTGATLVVEITLAGFPREYQLLYTLHRRQGIEKGVLLVSRIDEALDQLAHKVGEKLGRSYKIASSDYKSAFANEMLATGLELMQLDDFASAEKFLNAVIETEPDNLVAKRLLIKTLVEQKKYDRAIVVLAAAKRLAAQKNDDLELVRLGFWSGVNELQKGNLEMALDFLTPTLGLAEMQQDWLLIAYTAEMIGHAHSMAKDYATALDFYSASIKNHRVIQCPYGQAHGLLNVAQATAAMGDYDQAIEHTRAAMDLIAERDLRSLKEPAAKMLKTIEGSTIGL